MGHQLHNWELSLALLGFSKSQQRPLLFSKALLHSFGFLEFLFWAMRVMVGALSVVGILYRESHSIKSSSIEFLIDTNETDRQLEEWGRDREQVLCIMEKEEGQNINSN